MVDGALGLFDGSALDGHDNVALRIAADPDDTGPIDHAVTAGAAHRCARDFAAFRRGLLDGNVFGVQVNESADYFLQPLVRIMAAEIAVARVEVDPNGRALHQFIDTVQPLGVFAVLLVRLEPDPDATRLSDLRCFHQGVAHENMVLLLG